MRINKINFNLNNIQNSYRKKQFSLAKQAENQNYSKIKKNHFSALGINFTQNIGRNSEIDKVKAEGRLCLSNAEKIKEKGKNIYATMQMKFDNARELLNYGINNGFSDKLNRYDICEASFEQYGDIILAKEYGQKGELIRETGFNAHFPIPLIIKEFDTKNNQINVYQNYAGEFTSCHTVQLAKDEEMYIDEGRSFVNSFVFDNNGRVVKFIPNEETREDNTSKMSAIYCFNYSNYATETTVTRNATLSDNDLMTEDAVFSFYNDTLIEYTENLISGNNTSDYTKLISFDFKGNIESYDERHHENNTD